MGLGAALLFEYPSPTAGVPSIIVHGLRPKIAHDRAHLSGSKLQDRLRHLWGMIPHRGGDVGKRLPVQPDFQIECARAAFDAAFGLEEGLAGIRRIAV